MDIDFGTQELRHSRPKLREDIHFSQQTHNQESVYIVEDTLKSKYFRIGLPEYRFISFLNGQYSIGEALSQIAKELGDDAFSEHEAAIVLDWLLEMELLVPSSGVKQLELDIKRQKTKDQASLKYVNLLFLKVPLFNPEKLLSILSPLMSWMLGKRFFSIWLLVVFSGIYQVVINSEKFTVSSGQLFSFHNWGWLIGAWIVLKVIHELFHGLMCKRFGGHVYEAGVIWILFAPIGYVDATSSWMFESKWKRIYTAAAGMYIEIFIASIFVWFWAYSEPGPFRELAYNIIILSSVTTLLFNANPLMKFDGYYIFSDLVEIPNLYQDGSAFVKHLGKKYLLGMQSQFPSRSARQDLIIKVYGICSFIWRILVMLTILIIANHLFFGAGILLVVLSLIMLLGVPLFRLYLLFKEGNSFEQPNLWNFLLRMTLFLSVVFIAVTKVTFKQDVAAPSVVDYKNVQNVFASHDGFVEEFYVEDQQVVDKGQPILKLQNTQLDASIKTLEIKLIQARKQRNELLSVAKIANLQALNEKIQALNQQFLEKQQQQDSLLILAKEPGKIILSDMQTMLGRYVDRSTVLAKIVNDQEKEIIFVVEQSDFNQLQSKQGEGINIYITGRDKVAGTIHRISPKASNSTRYPQLTSLGGGVIPAVRSESRNQPLTLITPYFEVSVESDHIENTFPGETGWVEFPGEETSIVLFWQQRVGQWVDNIRKQI